MTTSGIVLLDKPAGLSSNAALQRVRRMLGAAKAGHVGSLDPLATGMLPICLEEATKIAADILSARKRYRFTVSLGVRTSTGDTEGSAVETRPVPSLDSERIAAALQSFVGPQKQVPPMYSALKRDGQPLYKLARAGVEVERPARDVAIYELPLIGFNGSTLELEVLCSKGTYVRTLAEDIAKALGTCGHVAKLRRLYVEPFQKEAMESLESIEQARKEGRWPRLLSADWPLQHLPALSLDMGEAARIRQGQSVFVHTAAPAPRVRLYDAAGTFLGIGESPVSGTVQPRRLLNITASP